MDGWAGWAVDTACMGWRLTPQMHVHGTACRAVDTANHTFSDLQNRTVETAPACPIIRSTLSAFKFGPHAFAMVVKASTSKRSFDPVLVRGPKAEKDVSWQSTGYIEDQHGVMRKDGWQYQSKIKTKIITASTPTAYIGIFHRVLFQKMQNPACARSGRAMLDS